MERTRVSVTTLKVIQATLSNIFEFGVHSADGPVGLEEIAWFETARP